MIRRLLCFSFYAIGATLAQTAIAAEVSGESETATGLANFGVGITLIGTAAILLALLVFRGAAARVGRTAIEKLGKRRIRKVLRAKSADVLEDFILPGAYGGLTHIDFAILTSGGILCIRTMHFNGIVFGAADEPQWTNVDSVNRRRFLNPIIQNDGRTTALQKIVPNVPVANLVVFTGNVQFTSPPEKNVIPVSRLESYIAKFVFGPCKIKDWDAVWLTVKSAALTDDETRKDFRAQLSFS